MVNKTVGRDHDWHRTDKVNDSKGLPLREKEELEGELQQRDGVRSVVAIAVVDQIR